MPAAVAGAALRRFRSPCPPSRCRMRKNSGVQKTLLEGQAGETTSHGKVSVQRALEKNASIATL
eukprot:1261630-Amphidinium_carterae.1